MIKLLILLLNLLKVLTPLIPHATATVLYSTLANHYFRSRNIWSAKGKTIPRRLNSVDPELAEQFIASFDDVFLKCNTESVIRFTEDILKIDGGFLFQGHKIEAPTSWRMG